MPDREPKGATTARPEARVDMRFPLRSAGIVFVLAMVGYFLTFGAIEHFRHRNGAWSLTFISDASGVPSVRIQQSRLDIHGVELRFYGERHATNGVEASVTLDRPHQPLPFGTRVFEDLTFLPGVETLELFGHQIELAPRVLVVNQKEIPWGSVRLITLLPNQKLPPEHRERNPRGKG